MPCLLRLLASAFLLSGLAAATAAEPFRHRGYYITFMRMPTLGLPAWKEIVDGIHDDGGNLLLLWMGGAFRSEQFPVTWRYNAEHANVRQNFARELIDHAHSRGIRVLLGFTPFGYDGVNQLPLERPELKATGKNGQPVGMFGIHSWGWNLCPSKPEAQRFMREYVREMRRFHPNVDGLLIESSDYAICHCDQCRGKFFEKEFEFVKAVSEEVWTEKPEAMVVVYPHYFSGAKVPGLDVRAARQPFDPRWTLFFTPHSAHLEPALIRQARDSLWWDESPSLRGPAEIRHGARRAQQAGCTGYVPSLEAFTYIATQPEDGQKWLVGKRQVPLGFGWLREGENPFKELPARVNRIAYREFAAKPDLAFDEFKQQLGRDIFGNAATPQLLTDLLELQRAFYFDRTWSLASPLVSPERVRARKEAGELKPETLADYRRSIDRLREIERRHRDASNPGARELHRLTAWVLTQWSGANASLLADPPVSP